MLHHVLGMGAVLSRLVKDFLMSSRLETGTAPLEGLLVSDVLSQSWPWRLVSLHSTLHATF